MHKKRKSYNLSSLPVKFMNELTELLKKDTSLYTFANRYWTNINTPLYLSEKQGRTRSFYYFSLSSVRFRFLRSYFFEKSTV